MEGRARTCVGVYGRTLLMSSSLLYQQCPAYCVRLIWMFFEMGGKRLYNCSFVECCFEYLFKIARSILVLFPFSYVPMRFVSVVLLYSSMDTVTAWKKYCFITSDRSVFHRINNISIAAHAFGWRILTSPSVDEIFLPRYVFLSINLRSPPF